LGCLAYPLFYWFRVGLWGAAQDKRNIFTLVSACVHVGGGGMFVVVMIRDIFVVFRLWGSFLGSLTAMDGGCSARIGCALWRATAHNGNNIFFKLVGIRAPFA